MCNYTYLYKHGVPVHLQQVVIFRSKPSAMGFRTTLNPHQPIRGMFWQNLPPSLSLSLDAARHKSTMKVDDLLVHTVPLHDFPDSHFGLTKFIDCCHLTCAMILRQAACLRIYYRWTATRLQLENDLTIWTMVATALLKHHMEHTFIYLA